MPFWPIPTGIAFALFLWGLYLNEWRVAGIVLAAYCAVRLWCNFSPDVALELGIGMIWIVAVIFMFRAGAYVTGTLFLLSSMVYPVFLLMGYRLEYLGTMAILTEAFALLALTAIGGGFGTMVYHSGDSHSGDSNRLSSYALGVS